MPRFTPCLLLALSLFCVQCTKELEKKPETQENSKKEEKLVEKEKENIVNDDTIRTTTEKRFDVIETDVKKTPDEPTIKKTKEKEVKKEVEVPKEVENTHTAEVVKEAKSKYAIVGNFYQGLAVVQSHEGKYGYIDTHGKEAISPKYDFAEDLSGEPAMARVRIYDKVGCINKNAQEIIPLKYRFVDKFYRGLAQIRLIDGESYYIDRQGAYVCDLLSDYYEDIARIKKGDKIGYINSYGKIIITPQYSYGTHFKNGQAEVKLKEKHIIINIKGECIKDCQ